MQPDPRDPSVAPIYESKVMFLAGEGGDFLRGLLAESLESLGVCLPTITVNGKPVTVHRYLGKGATSMVYAGQLGDQPCVLKLFHQQNALDRATKERKILTSIQSLTSSSPLSTTRFCKSSDDEKCLLLQPIGLRFALDSKAIEAVYRTIAATGSLIITDALLPKPQHLGMLLDIVERLHKLVDHEGMKFVHRDIKPGNFFVEVPRESLASFLESEELDLEEDESKDEEDGEDEEDETTIADGKKKRKLAEKEKKGAKKPRAKTPKVASQPPVSEHKLFLNDFGLGLWYHPEAPDSSSSTASRSAPVDMEGTRLHASPGQLAYLAGLAEGETPRWRYHQSDDLHGIVKTAYQFSHPTEFVPFAQSNPSLTSIQAWWERRMRQQPWNAMCAAADSLNYAELKRLLLALSFNPE